MRGIKSLWKEGANEIPEEEVYRIFVANWGACSDSEDCFRPLYRITRRNVEIILRKYKEPYSILDYILHDAPYWLVHLALQLGHSLMFYQPLDKVTNPNPQVVQLIQYVIQPETQGGPPNYCLLIDSIRLAYWDQQILDLENLRRLVQDPQTYFHPHYLVSDIVIYILTPYLSFLPTS